MMSSKKKSSKNKNKKRKTKQNQPPVSFLESHSLACVTGILPGTVPGAFPTSESSKATSIISVPMVSSVTTPVASSIVKELFIERFEREIVQPFSLRRDDGSSKRRYNEKTSMYTQRLLNKRQKLEEGQNQSDKAFPDKERRQRRRDHCKRRLIMGTNQCTRYLERVQQLQQQQDQPIDGIRQEGPQKEIGHSLVVPSLMVLARDIYPPTMLSQAPLWAQALNVPILLLPGQASSELGQALGTKKTSILLFLPRGSSTSSSASTATSSIEANDSTSGEEEDDDVIDSFIDYIKAQLQQKVNS